MKNTANTWDEIASHYNESQGETGDPLHQYMIDPVISEMLGNITGQTILDAGCGNGYWVRQLSKQASRVIGIDSSSALIEQTKSMNKLENFDFQVADLEHDLEFPERFFDTILSSMVFQYLSTIENTVGEFERILKKNGRVILAIQHPLFQYHFHLQAKGGGDTAPFLNPVSYFDRTTVEQTILSGKSKVSIYNRTVADYVKTFLRQGFVLKDFTEPEYSDELLKAVPRYKEVADFPRVAIFAFQKL